MSKRKASDELNGNLKKTKNTCEQSIHQLSVKIEETKKSNCQIIRQLELEKNELYNQLILNTIDNEGSFCIFPSISIYGIYDKIEQRRGIVFIEKTPYDRPCYDNMWMSYRNELFGLEISTRVSGHHNCVAHSGYIPTKREAEVTDKIHKLLTGDKSTKQIPGKDMYIKSLPEKHITYNYSICDEKIGNNLQDLYLPYYILDCTILVKK